MTKEKSARAGEELNRLGPGKDFPRRGHFKIMEKRSQS